MHSWDYMHGPWSGGIVMGLWMLLIILLAIVLVWMLIRGRCGHSGSPPSDESPLDIAQKRYARGEISREEFQRIKQDLRE